MLQSYMYQIYIVQTIPFVGIPNVAVTYEGTAFDGQNSFQLNLSVNSNKENMNYYATDRSSGPMFQMPLQFLSTSGNRQ